MKTKAELPETLSQALRWDGVKRRYVDAGLCEKCAAQAAWGHQVGFPLSHPPCEPCAEVIATFPTKASGPWRKLAPVREMSPAAIARLRGSVP